jgi:hypothetical protein
MRIRMYVYKAITRSIAILFVVAVSASVASAKPKAKPEAKIVVSLDVPSDSVPQYVCVVTSGGGCEGDCRDLQAVTTKYLARSNETLTVKNLPTAENAGTLPMGISGALQALGRRDTSCGDSTCNPSIQLHEQSPQALVTPPAPPPALEGGLTCTQNVRNTGSQRVAVLSLDYHSGNAKVGVYRLELFGTELIVQLLHKSDPKDFAFLDGIGGDYKSGATGSATRERAQLKLVPRCATYPLELPPRKGNPNESVSVKLNDKAVALCPATASIPLSIQIPAESAGSQLDVSVKSTEKETSEERETERYEASWSEPLPPRPLRLRTRMVELEWTRHCLTGSIPDIPLRLRMTTPAAESETTWTDRCPRAELTVAGARCTVEVSEEDRCRYRCEAPKDEMPTFSLPTPIRFTREGDQTITSNNQQHVEHVSVLAWNDTLTYAGQRLDSFVPAAERGIIVEYSDPAAWIGTARRPLERLEITRAGATGHTISLSSSKRPNWELVAAPNASCSDAFDGSVRGWRYFLTRPIVRDQTGNLEVQDPDAFAARLHDLSFVFGGGFLQPLVKSSGVKPFIQPLGLSASTKHRAGSHGGMWEGSLLYELTQLPFNALHPKGTPASDRLPSVLYQRLMFELSYLWLPIHPWSDRSVGRVFFGLTLGVGLGGPIRSETDKVGIVSPPYGLAGVFLRWQMGERWSADLGATCRIGERHRIFGYEDDVISDEQTFVGEPTVTDRRIVHIGWFLRLRRSIR